MTGALLTFDGSGQITGVRIMAESEAEQQTVEQGLARLMVKDSQEPEITPGKEVDQ